MGEHVIDTQGLLFCRMTPRWLFYWEKGKVNRRIQALVDLGKMCKSASEYTCRGYLTCKERWQSKIMWGLQTFEFLDHARFFSHVFN